MLSSFGKHLKIAAIKLAIRRTSPSRIPLVRERAKNVDCFTVEIKDSDGGPIDVLAKGLDKKCLTGDQWSGDLYEFPISIPLQHIEELEVRITHFFKHTRTEYTGAIDFLWGHITKKPHRFLFRNRIVQLFYNQTTRFRQDRIELLKEIHANHLKTAGRDEEAYGALFGDNRSFTEMKLFEDLYGNRAFEHPAFNKEYTAFKLLLGSLAATGDLVSENGKYRLSASSLKSIADFEEAERRHADSVRQNKRLFWITVVIAVATAMQAYIAFFKG
ncbi:MAG: hypothetical protein AAFY35_08480 [Pseudomonadota bacterium]